jgi:hypothetical protein
MPLKPPMPSRLAPQHLDMIEDVIRGPHGCGGGGPGSIRDAGVAISQLGEVGRKVGHAAGLPCPLITEQR